MGLCSPTYLQLQCKVALHVQARSRKQEHFFVTGTGTLKLFLLMSSASCTWDWVKPRLSFGTLPRARYDTTYSFLPSVRHSAVSWTESDRFLYIWGGEVVDPEDTEKDSVYKLDTSITLQNVTNHQSP